MSNTDRSKIIYNNRYGPNLTRISLSFVGIIVVGITAFYLAKKEIADNRQKIMLIKKEINETKVKYPSRSEIIKELKEKERLKNAANTTGSETTA